MQECNLWFLWQGLAEYFIQDFKFKPFLQQPELQHVCVCVHLLVEFLYN